MGEPGVSFTAPATIHLTITKKGRFLNGRQSVSFAVVSGLSFIAVLNASC